MSNNLTGEVEVVIGDNTYSMAPTFKVAAAIEAATGKSLVQLIDDLRVLKTSAIALVLFHAIKGKKPPLESIGDALIAGLQGGDNGLFEAAMKFVLAYFPKSDEPASGNVKTLN